MSKDNLNKNEEVEVEQETTNDDFETSAENKGSASANLVSFDDRAIKLNMLSKINEIDSAYKKGVNAYREKLYRYNLEIEKLKSEIEIESKKNIEEEKRLFAVESILEYESKHFEGLHHKFTQKMESLIELRDEYKENLEEHIYNEKFSRKEREVFLVLDEIEEKEILLLNKELEKINLSNQLRKKLERVEELRRLLKELELEKGYFESSELQNVSYLNVEQLSLKKDETQIVDTVIMDKE